jgi:periplasmic divalent cation tolerance protein
MKDYQIVFCTCPNIEVATTIATNLVENALAACVNLLPSIRSVFRWEGKIENIEETLLIIKTSRLRYAELEMMIRSQHPYTVPEIISLDIQQGFADYLAFMEQNLTTG